MILSNLEKINMEKISTKPHLKKSWLSQKLATLALCGALVFWNISCQMTWNNGAKKQENKENIIYELSSYINARKDLVNKYNQLLQYPKSESNRSDINKSLSQIYEVIMKYDKKIEELGKDLIKAIDDYNSWVSKAGKSYSHNEPLDPNRWDYLLKIQ